MKVRILGDKDKFIYPRKGTERSAAYDLYVQEDVVIKPGRQVIPMGFAMELDPNTAAEIHPRSGFASKGMEGYVVEFTPIEKFNNTANFLEVIPNYDVYETDRHLNVVFYINTMKRIRGNVDVLYGLIDEDYRNEIGVIVHNRDCTEFVIKRGTRIAQMLIINVPQTIIEYVDELSETERKGGFGSTGV